MKKLVLFTIALVTSIAFVSCEKETILSIDQTSISIPDMGGSQTILLTANKIWTASSNQSWCKVSPSTGEEVSSSRITITCEPNTTYDARNASVTFTCSEKTVTLNVSQATNNGLFVSQTSYELTKEAQQVNIEVKANVQFSVEVDGGCKEWVKYNSTKALTTSTVVLDIAENKTYDSREGKVIIKQDGGSLSSTITIKQSQLDGLFLTTSEYNLSNEKHILTVEVSTNVEFDVRPEADWVKYVQTKGLSTKQIVLEVAENDTYDQRETKVNVKQKNGNLSGTITIKQDEKYGILVSQSEYNLTNEAQTIEVEVKYNVDFEVSIPDGCKDWIKQVSTKGLNTKNYTFSIAKNETYDNREGNITFKQKRGAISTTVAIKQEQTDYLNVSKTEYCLKAESVSLSIDVHANIDYSLSIPDSINWIRVIETKGIEKSTIALAIDENKGIRSREAELLIVDIKGVFPHSIHIIQERKEIPDNEIWYTSVDENIIEPYSQSFGASLLTNSFDGGKWVLRFDTKVGKIGYYAFYNCKNLKEIILPKGVTLIDENAFSLCRKMTYIDIPDEVKTIETSAFYLCESLTDVVLPASLVLLGGTAFGECYNLQTINIPEGVTLIKGGTFIECWSLSSITLPKGITFIGIQAFENCRSLVSIDIPPLVTSIGERAFNGCKKVEVVYCRPKIAPDIEKRVFEGNAPKRIIYVPQGSEQSYLNNSSWVEYSDSIRGFLFE